MKNTILAFVISILSISNVGAQSYSDAELYQKFKNKELSYNDIEKRQLANYIIWYEKELEYGMKIVDAPTFRKYRGGAYIEIEQDDGNIYTYPTVFWSNYIEFYNSQISKNELNFYRSIHGRSYSLLHVTMDKIKIGEQTADIRSCLSPLYKNDDIKVITPSSYLKYTNGEAVLSINATYAGTPEIIYTKPQYTVFAGQLIEVHSGIDYHTPLYEVSHVFLINPKTMTSKSIPLEGITNVCMKYNSVGELYFMNKSVYCKEDWSRGKQEHMAISQNQSPIYTAYNYSNGTLTLKTAIVPKEGDVIIDIQKSFDGKYVYLCGSTTKQGYVGYENGILIILKKKNNDTYEEIVRYRSKKKDRYYSKIVVLDNENICLKYDNWDSGYLNNGCKPENFDIINIPSIVNPPVRGTSPDTGEDARDTKVIK